MVSAQSDPEIIRVLHVDDESDQRELVKIFLEKFYLGLQVESVSSGEEGLRLLEEQPFECVVSDHQMPVMDGIELARRIRMTSGIPFIIYTGRGSEEVASAAFVVGVDDYVRKESDPSHYEVLAKRVRAAVEKQKAEEAIKDSEEKYKNLINNSNDIISTVDETGIRTFLSPSVKRVLGYEPEEMVGRSTFDFMFPEDIESTRKAHESVVREGRSFWEYENRYIGKDGRIVTLAWNMVTLRDEKGDIIGSQGVGRDVTERNEMEEEMRRHAEHLEELVEEKTEELLDAERMVTAGKIATMVGHDLRGPLQTINSALYIMKNTPEKSDEAQEMARQAVQRATNMLEELRSKTRDTALSLVPTDLAALIRTTVEEAQIPDSVSIALEADDGLVNVSLDPLQMRRVLDNLIGNAIDAMSDGGVLRVAVDRRIEEVVVEVSDTGVGIPEEKIPDLFKPFQSTKLGGLGLGLAYCKRAVEAHGGTITVDSKRGEGTTFTIKIPLKLK